MQLADPIVAGAWQIVGSLYRLLEDAWGKQGGPPLMPADPQRRLAADKVLSRGASSFSDAGISFLSGSGRYASADSVPLLNCLTLTAFSVHCPLWRQFRF